LGAVYIDDIYLESFTGKAPYATGDAKSHRWGNTNLGLYGSSFAGIFGGIVEKTDVPGILQLDLLATDYFRDQAYPTYLYYNPHGQDKKVTLNIEKASDLYDTVTKSFIARNVSGQTSVNIVADSAMVLVVVPEGCKAVHKGGRLLINDVVIDYHAD